MSCLLNKGSRFSCFKVSQSIGKSYTVEVSLKTPGYRNVDVVEAVEDKEKTAVNLERLSYGKRVVLQDYLLCLSNLVCVQEPNRADLMGLLQNHFKNTAEKTEHWVGQYLLEQRPY